MDQENSKNNSQKENDSRGSAPRPADIKKYRDLEGVSLRKLEFGLWFVEHKENLRKALVVFLIIIAASSWSYTIYGFSYYLAKGMEEDDLIYRELANSGRINHDYIVQSSPQSLSFGAVKTVSSAANSFDFIVEAKNLNQRHWGEFEYYFLVDGVKTDSDSSFVLPGETKYLLIPAQRLNHPPGSIRVAVDKINWRRIDVRRIPDWQEFSDEHLAVTIAKDKYISSRESGLSERINISQVEFEATNNSPYNYLQAAFYVLLYNRSNLVAVNRYSLNGFMSGRPYFIRVSMPEAVGRVDRVEIKPEIAIMNENNYLKFEGGIGEEK